VQINGTFPHLAVKAGHHPKRTETGIGALMPWAEKLWFVTYVAHKEESGSGTGLFSVDDDMTMTRHPESVVGTYANRMIHAPSDQLVIGPHLIDPKGKVRTVHALKDIRITATAEHLEDPDNKVYMLGMEGEFYELDVHTLETHLIADLVEELNIPDGSQIHFKAMYSAHGRVVVGNNTYDNPDYIGEREGGRLAEWDGKQWTVLARAQFNEATGRKSIGRAILTTGQDRASAILKVFVDGSWDTYRLPKGTHTQDHTVTTEWPRIREVESERWLMNASGLFYELPAMQYAGKVWGVKPVCSHLRIIGDFCAWNGLLVLAGDQSTPIFDKNLFVGQPQANLWFGKTDDLWNFGKPTGWGGPWHRTAVEPDEPSDPFLMTGFDKKCLHLTHDAAQPVRITAEVDFLGDGDWRPYQTFEIEAKGYRHHSFPEGFSAHWIRFRADAACTATAHLHYT